MVFFFFSILITGYTSLLSPKKISCRAFFVVAKQEDLEDKVYTTNNFLRSNLLKGFRVSTESNWHEDKRKYLRNVATYLLFFSFSCFKGLTLG